MIMKILYITIALFLVFSNLNITESNLAAKSKKIIYYFYGTGCPNCKQTDPIVKKLSKKYGLVLKKYEVWYNKKNRAFLLNMAKKINKRPQGVPLVIIEKDMYLGLKKISSIENNIKKYLK